MAPINPPAAVVYLEGDFRLQQNNNSKAPAQMAQKNIAFAPDLLPILVGTAVDFPNMDDAYHNVFSYSKTKRFDLGRYRKDEKAAAIVFDKPGAVTIHCEIHERMRGTILVLETPYFQKTDTAGRYRSGASPRRELRVKSLGGWRRRPRASDGTKSRHDFACRFQPSNQAHYLQLQFYGGAQLPGEVAPGDDARSGRDDRNGVSGRGKSAD